MIYLKLAADPDNPQQIEGEFHVTEAGLLTVREDGKVPRTYSPHAWISFEDFSDEPPALNFGV